MDDRQHSIDHRPMVVVILDGWGYSDDAECNAIHAARKPTWDELWRSCPHTLLQGSGAEVGLPADQMGNSEVGHLNLGAGRVVRQELSRIERAITDGDFYANEVLLAAVDAAHRAGKAVHVLGLLSPGGVHSHEAQIHAMVRMAVERGAPRVYLHAFLDGRDTPPRSARASLVAAEGLFRELGRGAIASVVGRYYAMDRDQRWPRTQAAFELVCRGQAEYRAADGAAAIDMAYARGESDEFVKPTAIAPPGGRAVAIEDGDVIVFMNFRADRARQLTRCFVDREFTAFRRGAVPRLGAFVSLTEYHKDFDVAVAFPPQPLKNVFGEYIAGLGLRQLRIAETEKYAHVTFFFNGGEERQFAGEERILIPSPKVATYDLQPEMSAPQLTDRLVAEIGGGRFDVIICNYANPDMVGHTGVFPAAVRAIEAVDACLGRVLVAVRRAGGELVITADHGNAEQMCDRATDQPHTAHTSNLVPLIYVGRPARIAARGTLADVAPSLLRIMGIAPPGEMSGRALIELVAP